MKIRCIGVSIALLWLSTVAAQTTNPACPGASGTAPHCMVLTWTAPGTGVTPTGYNVYTGGTKAAQCATVAASTCTKVGSVTAGVLTLTQNSSALAPLVEGSTYYYVVTSLNGTAESGPSAEVSATVPFLVPNAPASPQAVAH